MSVINPNGAGEYAHSGNWYAWLDGYGTTHTDTLSQTVTIRPAHALVAVVKASRRCSRSCPGALAGRAGPPLRAWTPITISEKSAVSVNRPNSRARVTAPTPGREKRTTPNATGTSPPRMNSARIPAGLAAAERQRRRSRRNRR